VPGEGGVRRVVPAGGALDGWTVDVRCVTSAAEGARPRPLRSATSALGLFPRTHAPAHVFQNMLKNIPRTSVSAVNSWERAVAYSDAPCHCPFVGSVVPLRLQSSATVSPCAVQGEQHLWPHHVCLERTLSSPCTLCTLCCDPRTSAQTALQSSSGLQKMVYFVE